MLPESAGHRSLRIVPHSRKRRRARHIAVHQRSHTCRQRKEPRIPGLFQVQMVRVKGLEPSWGCPHTDLNRTRLPIPPHPHLLSDLGRKQEQMIQDFTRLCKTKIPILEKGSAACARSCFTQGYHLLGDVGTLSKSSRFRCSPSQPRPKPKGDRGDKHHF